MRKTKIVCTIGPASQKLEVIKEMIKAGMNVARLNFSHGSHEEHRQQIATIRQAAEELGQNIAILLDTKGPEIRLGEFSKSPVMLETGQQFSLTTEQVLGNQKRVMVTYRDLPRNVKKGDRILVDDGLIELIVEAVESTEVLCRVVNGGKLSDHKGVNLPGIQVNLPAVTEKDIDDIKFGITQQVDFIAASFVRKASDVLAIRRILEAEGAKIDIIAKIESRESINNLNEIIKVADGIMVARGDLGVEIPAEEVPIIQKQIIARCNLVGKPVIIATQMLDSMINNPRPTRAEASDVANAIFDGTDAVMLSGESASGKHPIEAVKTMDRIARRAEKVSVKDSNQYNRCTSVTDAIGQAVCVVAGQLDAAAIVTITASGYTARMISRYRPKSSIVAVTSDLGVMRRLVLVWGVIPLPSAKLTVTDQMINEAVNIAMDHEVIKGGDLVVITAGVPVGLEGSTNLMKIQTVGTPVARGAGILAQSVVGVARICQNAEEAAKLEPGEILVTTGIDANFVPYLNNAGAILTEEGGLTSHAAIVAVELKIPAVVGVAQATSLFKSGELITVDGQRGLIYRGFARVL
ncbi:pyruvate kinase [Desulfotruncus alcoholivorax]|uniref:pyruvate kinase n=1 Tax=Desulfotruncus alcoholivorax TaxID=265477 RepID=UPI0003FAFF18|nr:pyruvate kinase [Desulfotruncus alcoholivorax]